MKAIQKLISLITILAIAATLCACANQDKPDIPEDTQSIAPIADEAEPEITLEYFYTSHLSEDNYMTDEDKPPEAASGAELISASSRRRSILRSRF